MDDIIMRKPDKLRKKQPIDNFVSRYARYDTFILCRAHINTSHVPNPFQLRSLARSSRFHIRNLEIRRTERYRLQWSHFEVHIPALQI